MNRFLNALKENTDDIRKKTLTLVGTVAAALLAGIVLNKLSEDRVDVIVLQETAPEEDIIVATEDE